MYLVDIATNAAQNEVTMTVSDNAPTINSPYDIAYEIDEGQHFTSSSLRNSCKDRQAYISDLIGCAFKRIRV